VNKLYAILALSLVFLMISPVLADVFVPPGPSASAVSANFPNLPTSSLSVNLTNVPGLYPLTVVLSGVPSGYDVTNQAYTGFCVNLTVDISGYTIYSATLKSSLTMGSPWDKINYILNNQGAATAQDVQAAIWLVEGYTAAQITSLAGFTPTAAALALYSNAELYGNSFVPSAGQILAVRVQVSGGQNLLIELRMPSDYGNQSEWISPTLASFIGSPGNLGNPIGTFYTNGPFWNTYTGTGSTTAVTQTKPWAYTSTGFSSSTLPATPFVPYGDQVTVVGFIPGVNVAPGEVPPPVELQVTWNGQPGVITLTDPSNYTVSNTEPPKIYSDVSTSYTWCYPTTGANKAATYQLWSGNYAQVLSYLWGTTTAPAWWTAVYGPAGVAQNGEWFWYTFTPNAGDWIALDSSGQCLTPYTYDITAQFTYLTTEIWFNHNDWNVCLLQIHKDVSWSTNEIIEDQISVADVGAGSLATVNSLVLTQTFPTDTKLTEYPSSAEIGVISTSSGKTLEPLIALPGFSSLEYPNTLALSTTGLPSAYTNLMPGQTLVISILIQISDVATPSFTGTIVYQAMATCNQIAPWKPVIGYAALPYPGSDDSVVVNDPTTLWTGYYLYVNATGVLTFRSISRIGGVSSVVSGPVLSMLTTPITITPGAWTLDPAPVPLIAGETSVTAADVALVRNAMLGLAPYDPRMDVNANGIVDVQDLAAYEAAAGMS
jgi:hypothetical protein